MKSFTSNNSSTFELIPTEERSIVLREEERNTEGLLIQRQKQIEVNLFFFS